MQYICILGNYTECNKQVCDKLVKMGYKLNNLYGTEREDGVTLISEKKFKELESTDKMIQLEEKDSILYGVLNPFGVKKYVSIIPIKYFKKLRDKYGNQVSGFYIATDNDEILDEDTFGELGDNNCTVMVYDTSYDINSLIAEVLKRVR